MQKNTAENMFRKNTLWTHPETCSNLSVANPSNIRVFSKKVEKNFIYLLQNMAMCCILAKLSVEG